MNTSPSKNAADLRRASPVFEWGVSWAVSSVANYPVSTTLMSTSTCVRLIVLACFDVVRIVALPLFESFTCTNYSTGTECLTRMDHDIR